MATTSQRSSTAVTSFPALVACMTLGTFSLAVAYFTLPPLLTLLLLPLPVLLTYAVARAAVGLPPTIMGVEGKAPAVPRGQQRYQLVAMPINHFGEKLRWCMDLLAVDYEESNVGGILSIFARGRTVPWLVDRLSCSLIGNSDEALCYLSAVHVPSMQGEAAQKGVALLRRSAGTMAWEERLNALGHAIQGWAYYYLLARNADPDITLRYWGAKEPTVPWMHRLALQLGYPLFKGLMRKAFTLHDESARQKRYDTIVAVLDDADAALEQSGAKHLTGESISYVDISFCALVGPLLPSTIIPLWANGRFASFAPLQDHPSMPTELTDFEQALRRRPCGQYVERMFRQWRNRSFGV
ncbi:MAG: hypothetical protein E2O35_08450 [Proteobacteria bacterium]|nr:MAG: hypothetical protein E2O35_08450 [Pseudomonadota bacterium]